MNIDTVLWDLLLQAGEDLSFWHWHDLPDVNEEAVCLLRWVAWQVGKRIIFPTWIHYWNFFKQSHSSQAVFTANLEPHLHKNNMGVSIMNVPPVPGLYL